jgi:tyrosyl-tRNA synthetase
MSIPDTLLDEWLRLASGLDGHDLARARTLAISDPYAAKRLLARTIVGQFHDNGAASRAEQHFDRLFRSRAEPEVVPTLTLRRSDPSIAASGGRAPLVRILTAAGLTASGSEAVRLIEQGAITVDGERAQDRHASIPADGTPVLIRRGKRHFIRVSIEP